MTPQELLKKKLRDFYFGLMVSAVSCCCWPCRLSDANPWCPFQMTDISLKGRGPFTVFVPSSEAFERERKEKVTEQKFLLLQRLQMVNELMMKRY